MAEKNQNKKKEKREYYTTKYIIELLAKIGIDTKKTVIPEWVFETSFAFYNEYPEAKEVERRFLNDEIPKEEANEAIADIEKQTQVSLNSVIKFYEKHPEKLEDESALPPIWKAIQQYHSTVLAKKRINYSKSKGITVENGVSKNKLTLLLFALTKKNWIEEPSVPNINNAFQPKEGKTSFTRDQLKEATVADFQKLCENLIENGIMFNDIPEPEDISIKDLMETHLSSND